MMEKLLFCERDTGENSALLTSDMYPSAFIEQCVLINWTHRTHGINSSKQVGY